MSFVARLASSSKQLEGRQRRLVGEPLTDRVGERRRLRRPADASVSARRDVVGVLDRIFALDATNGGDRHRGTPRHVRLAVAGTSEHLDLVANEERKHLLVVTSRSHSA